MKRKGERNEEGKEKLQMKRRKKEKENEGEGLFTACYKNYDSSHRSPEGNESSWQQSRKFQTGFSLFLVYVVATFCKRPQERR